VIGKELILPFASANVIIVVEGNRIDIGPKEEFLLPPMV